MKLCLLPGLAMLIALWVHPAAARLELSAEEQEIVHWSRSVTGPAEGNNPAEDASRVDALLVGALAGVDCPATRDWWDSADRWLDPRYLAIVDESVRALRQIESEDARSNNLVLEDRWEAALIFAFRSWDRPKQLEWLRYMRSPEAKGGFEWWTRLNTLVLMQFHATDRSSGKPVAIWVNWLGEVLTRMGLSAEFARAANAVQPGLGDTFVTHLAWPAGKVLAPDQKQAREDLIDRLVTHWSDILVELPKLAGPSAVQMRNAWVRDRIVGQILDAYRNVDKDFLAQTGNPDGRHQRVDAALSAALTAKVDQNCAALR